MAALRENLRAKANIAKMKGATDSLYSSIVIKIDGPDLAKQLPGLSESMQRGGLRRTLNKVGTLIAKDVRKRTPLRQIDANVTITPGGMRKSIDKKVKVKGVGGYVVIGSNKAKAFPSNNRFGRYRPALVFHLVEAGFRHPGGAFTTPQRMLARAYRAKLSQARRIIERDLDADIVKSWKSRMRNRAKREIKILDAARAANF